MRDDGKNTIAKSMCTFEVDFDDESVQSPTSVIAEIFTHKQVPQTRTGDTTTRRCQNVSLKGRQRCTEVCMSTVIQYKEAYQIGA
jgi:hypothetical protein